MGHKKTFSPENITFRQLVPPIVLEMLLRATVGVVNATFLSRIARSAVTAVNVANQYIGMCQTIATAIATGTIVCLNQAIGMRNRHSVNKYTTIAICANIVAGLFFGILFFFFSGPFLSIMTFETGELREMAVHYMRIVGTSMVIQCAQIVMSSINRSSGYTKAPLITNIMINVVNLAGCYLVVNRYILTDWDPIVGVAACNVFAQVCGLGIALVILLRSPVSVRLRYIVPFPWADFKLALSIGVPAGLNNIAYSVSQIVTSSIISQTSQLMFDAKSYLSTVINYVALVGIAFAQASNIMIGYRVGAGDFDDAYRQCIKTNKIAICCNLVFSGLLILFYKSIFTGLYGRNEGFEEIIKIAGTIVLIDVVVEIGRAMNNCLSGALQATGDVTFQLIVNQASGWIVAVGGSYLFGIVLGWELYGIWVAFALDEMTRGLILLHRWRSRKWEARARERIKTIAAGETAYQ